MANSMKHKNYEKQKFFVMFPHSQESVLNAIALKLASVLGEMEQRA